MDAETAALDRLLYAEADADDLARLDATLDDPERRDDLLATLATDAALRALGHDPAAFAAGVRDAITRERVSEQFTARALDTIARGYRRRLAWRRLRGGFAALVLATALVVVGWWWLERDPAPRLESGAVPASGELHIADRDLRLDYADGTWVEFAVGSRWRRLPGPGKRLELLAGRLAAEVAAQDPGRPFEILAGPSRVRVLGTRLEVLAGADAQAVRVTHGRVAFSRRSPGAQAEIVESVEVAAGGLALAETGRALHQAAADDRTWHRLASAVGSGRAVAPALRQRLAAGDAAFELQPGTPAAAGRDLIGIDWVDLGDYRKRMRYWELGEDHVVAEEGSSPPPWSSNVWDRDSLGEIALEPAPGLERQAWRITNLAGRAATQLMLWRPFALRGDSRYRFSLRYRSEHPHAALRLRLELDGEDRFATSQEASVDGWRWISITIDTPASGSHLAWNLQNNTVGADRSLWITDVTLVRVGDAPAHEDD